MCLICLVGYACRSRYKFRQINHENYTTTKGLILTNYRIAYGTTFTYIFNADATIATNALLTLLNAYERTLNLQHRIPTDIKTQIIKFYGHSIFTSKSIMVTRQFATDFIPANVAVDQLSVGKTIEISFDECNPKLYNIPTMLMSEEYNDYHEYNSIALAICGCCGLIIYVVIILVFQFWTGFYYVMGLIVASLVFCYVYQNYRRGNSAETRAEDYGTFRNKTQKSENISKEKCDYIKMEMDSPEHHH